MLKKEMRIAVIGLGILGGSYAQGLSQAGYDVTGVDIDYDTLQYAEEKGWVRRAVSNPAVISDCDLIISCLYPKDFIAWLKENQKYMKKGAYLSDVTGIKREVMKQIRTFLRDDIEYIACHPMAGRESSGILYASSALFEKANFIIVPDEGNTPEGIQLARDIAEALHFGNISVLTPEEHDRIISFLSQLPHVITMCLMNRSNPEEIRKFSGDSFRSITRIARMNENLWPDLFVMNKDVLLEEIDGFMQEMADFREMLEDEDMEKMKEKMRLSTAKREQLGI